MPRSGRFAVAQAKLYGRECQLYEFLLDKLIELEGDLPLDEVTPDVLKRFEAAIAIPHQPLVTHCWMRTMGEILERAGRLG